METIKKGSRGDAVKKLQELLHMENCDGIFGPATEACLVAFQAQHGLNPDAICGPKSWAALLAEPATKEQAGGLNIIMLATPQVFTKRSKRSIKFISIHYTAGASSKKGSARSTRDVFLARLKTNSKGSTDFSVDDAEIVQFNPDCNYYSAWAIGDTQKYTNGGATYKNAATNSNTISIEICCTLAKGSNAAVPNHSGWYFTEAVLENAAKLTKYLMKAYNIPIDHVIRHYDVTGKLCPGVPGWNNAPLHDPNTGKQIGKNSTSNQWQDFKRRLE